MSRLWLLLVFLLVSCSSCEKTGRTDVVRNEALKESCTAGAIIEIMNLDRQIGREYACSCVYGSVKSDANNCASIIRLNDKLATMKACKDNLKSDSHCRVLFRESK